MNWFTGLKIALLGVITAALVACGAVPSDGASPTDANHTDAAATDRPAPQPDASVAPDAPLPPPPDVMQITPDLPPPPPDAPEPEDASVPPMDAPPPPPDAVVMRSFNPSTCGQLPLRRWRVRGTAGNGDTIGCRMGSDGNAALELPDNIAARLGETSAVCDPDQVCHAPDFTTPSHWMCAEWNVSMTQFSCSRGSETVIIESVP